jgi:hypothetical protein
MILGYGKESSPLMILKKTGHRTIAGQSGGLTAVFAELS